MVKFIYYLFCIGLLVFSCSSSGGDDSPIEEPKDITPITDFTFSANNIRGNFCQFKYRYVYQDNTKSTFSPISEISTMDDLFFPIIEQL